VADAADAAGSASSAALDLAVTVARAAEEKLASDVVVLDVGDVLGICDYFVITTARNERQVKAVVDAVEESARSRCARRPRAEEGRGARRWVLIDFGDVVVHVFHEEERAHYRLERLYGDVPRIPWRAEEVAGPAHRDEAG
jgi:ribosome-associated protein